MSKIAAKFHISLQQLEQANPQVKEPSKIQVNQVLNIPGQSAGGGGGGGLDANQAAALQMHNNERQNISNKAGVDRPDLVWDKDLAASAQQWANQLAASGEFKHSGGPNGENLFMMGPASGATEQKATQGWLNEGPQYGGQPIDGNFAKYGHYTQIIWPDTSRVGIAKAKYANKDAMVYVAQYQSRGNFMGRSAYTGK